MYTLWGTSGTPYIRIYIDVVSILKTPAKIKTFVLPFVVFVMLRMTPPLVFGEEMGMVIVFRA
jgi:hypothetical protein